MDYSATAKELLDCVEVYMEEVIARKRKRVVGRIGKLKIEVKVRIIGFTVTVYTGPTSVYLQYVIVKKLFGKNDDVGHTNFSPMRYQDSVVTQTIEDCWQRLRPQNVSIHDGKVTWFHSSKIGLSQIEELLANIVALAKNAIQTTNDMDEHRRLNNKSTTSLYRGRAKTLADDCIDLAEVNHVLAVEKSRERRRLLVLAFIAFAAVAVVYFGWWKMVNDPLISFCFNMLVFSFNVVVCFTPNIQQRLRSKNFKKRIAKFRKKIEGRKQLVKSELFLEA